MHKIREARSSARYHAGLDGKGDGDGWTALLLMINDLATWSGGAGMMDGGDSVDFKTRSSRSRMSRDHRSYTDSK